MVLPCAGVYRHPSGTARANIQALFLLILPLYTIQDTLSIAFDMLVFQIAFLPIKTHFLTKHSLT